MNSKNLCNGCGSKKLVNISKKLNICKKCLLVSITPSKDLKKFNNSNIKYNLKYKWLEDNQKKFKNKKQFIEQEIIKKGEDIKKQNFDKILNFTIFKKNDLILDFGSGYGPFLNAMKKNYNVVGLEPNKDSFLFSKKLGHKVINSYLTKNLFVSKKFKLIFSRTTLTYVYDIKKMFNIFYKILNNDGYLIFYLHQYKFSKHISNQKYFDSMGFSEQANIFSNSSLKNLLLINNFEIVHFNSNIDATLLIAKKSINKLKYSRQGSIKFEIFYIKYLLIKISKFFLFLFKTKKILSKTFKKIIS